MVNQGTVSHEFYMEHTGDPLIRCKFRNWNCSMFPDRKCSSLPRASPPTHCSFSMTTESSWTGSGESHRSIDNWFRNGRFALFQQQIRDLLAQGAPIDALGQLLVICFPSHGGAHTPLDVLTDTFLLGLQSHMGSQLVDVQK